jgi:hypothetical protein
MISGEIHQNLLKILKKLFKNAFESEDRNRMIFKIYPRKTGALGDKRVPTFSLQITSKLHDKKCEMNRQLLHIHLHNLKLSTLSSKFSVNRRK